MSFTVAIVGRPNVGKSTLFNRLAGKRLALVDDTPGVTRDWRSAPARVGGLSFTVVDTAGLEEAFDDSLEARMRRQTDQAISRADVVLLLIDARTGLTPLDRHFAAGLRRCGRPVLLVANKCEGRSGLPGLLEAYELGMGDPLALSAEHGEGLADLVEALLPLLPDEGTQAQEETPEPQPEPEFKPAPEANSSALNDAEPQWAGEDAEEDEDDSEEPAVPRGPVPPLNLAIVGRPNVGKSTLLNALLGEERVLTGPEAGMTRDAITADWSWRGRAIRLVDTAGMRKRARVEHKLEKLAVADALRVIRLAEVVVLVLDSAAILDKQDLAIASMVIEEGRVLVIAINKWDIVTDRTIALNRLRDRLETSLPQARGLPTVTVSALEGRGMDALMTAVIEAHTLWNRRIPTRRLNEWLQQVIDRHPPPLASGRRVRLRYITQIKARPPTFVLWTSRPSELPESYLRYLAQCFRDRFGMPGVPLRMMLRKSDNPYVGKQKS